ncbi:alpha-L-arabinofuranosidase [Arthrobacter sp. V4I6]|uniref:alpha-L-arabinofuranosidase C-terminal domain-containing protein n=1 Tax=unclassified Arthrobacter TaxID=235627 RepID=UPI002789FBF4|nr:MULTISPECIES: alpha-L-arabinofuranosidase C-terminal domain-containing protein [unclassified Arthrobacter]MDQ0822430.1 alpha-L-arabinofuranosidase [Arthrobacter sp. V1I7]MDQ0852056.1 alpha-L-arabinofuranosidase [Arthrobacter sp. V4I6]
MLLAGSLAAALLSLSPVAGAYAEPDANRTITIDAGASGPAIDSTMYGAFYEDINQGADGGIYAELVQNRSFEFNSGDNAAFTPMTAWETLKRGSDGTVAVADDGNRLNENNRNYLQIDATAAGSGSGAGVGVRNSGWNAGQKLEAHKKYNYSVWARTSNPSGSTLAVTLETPEGTRLDLATIKVKGDQWTKYQVTLSPKSSTGAGRLATLVQGTGTVRLDMVSLFPKDTWNGRQNGLRKDLAEKIDDLNPGFLRFPGGCIVNTGSYDTYSAPNYTRSRTYQWKETIGPVEQRPANRNFWGYNQTYGLGYMEYFQWAEDLGAVPVPVVPVGVTGCGDTKRAPDQATLDRYIQDTLDLIEFANGDAGTEWGAKRIAYGHPEPYNLDRIGLGNEEYKPEFKEYFTQFYNAVRAKHPEIQIIGNTGPFSQGPEFEELSRFNAETGVDFVDEHYYNDPSWFLNNNHRYDSYDRNSYKVFLGEYASRGNKPENALAEASYMTGLERNADVVKMASYAPLIANDANTQWSPDMMFFNGTSVRTTPNYEVQKLFMNNVGSRVVPSTQDNPTSTVVPISGKIGLSTWATSARYDDVKVTGADGTALFSDDFSGTAAAWTGNGTGSWSIQDGGYVQSSTTAQDTMVTAGSTDWSNYTLSTKATKLAGSEGFLVSFGVKDTGNYFWWNLGGWNNSKSVVEKAVNGGKSTMIEKNTVIETGREYDIRVEVSGRTANLYLDNVLWGTVDDRQADPVYSVATKDEASGDTIVKVVNTSAQKTLVDINVTGAGNIRGTAAVTTLTQTADGQNMAPASSTFSGAGAGFTYAFEPQSVTFIRLADTRK